MKNKDKIRRIGDRDRCWAEMREQETLLRDIMMGEKTSPDTHQIACFCLELVLMDFELYGNNFLETDEKIKEINNSKDMFQVFTKLCFVTNELKIIYNKNVSCEQRQTAIDRIRLQGWSQILASKPELLALKANNYIPLNEEEINILLRCMGVVYMELLLQELEIKIYYP